MRFIFTNLYNIHTQLHKQANIDMSNNYILIIRFIKSDFRNGIFLKKI